MATNRSKRRSGNTNLSRNCIIAKLRLVTTINAGFLLALFCCHTLADVPAGSEESAKKYYRSVSKTLEFATPETIFETTLDDVATYLGYKGLTGTDLQRIPPALLMDSGQLLSGDALQQRDVVIASLGSVPFQPGEILVTRFFAPKIMDISVPPPNRKLGWRKLVRLLARPGSAAKAHQISSGIILFNFFTDPGVAPFAETNESVNTQVMLITDKAHVPDSTEEGPDTLYWLDYDQLSKGGRLAFALHASFDANELPATAGGTKAYFVPDGCVACHGANPRRSMVNYLDTDHWFDRIETDFPEFKTNGLHLLVDAQTNDPSSLAYILAFDVIRRFNAEADEQVLVAQRAHDETLASQKWIQLHQTNSNHFPPVLRSIGPKPHWANDPDDSKTLDALNQYCFRCHGTVKFSVFNKSALTKPEMLPIMEMRLSTNAPVGIRMPPDRPLPEDIRVQILRHFIP